MSSESCDTSPTEVLFGGIGSHNTHSHRLCALNHHALARSNWPTGSPSCSPVMAATNQGSRRTCFWCVTESLLDGQKYSHPLGSFQYQTGEANGVKFASRDIPGPVASLAIVAKAGTRFEPIPGLAEGLHRIAFKVRCNKQEMEI